MTVNARVSSLSSRLFQAFSEDSICAMDIACRDIFGSIAWGFGESAHLVSGDLSGNLHWSKMHHICSVMCWRHFSRCFWVGAGGGERDLVDRIFIFVLHMCPLRRLLRSRLTVPGWRQPGVDKLPICAVFSLCMRCWLVKVVGRGMDRRCPFFQCPEFCKIIPCSYFCLVDSIQ